MNLKVLTTAVAVLALASASLAQSPLGQAGEFNVFTRWGFTGFNSDIEGKLASGGNVNLTNYDVGLKDPGGVAIYAGEDLIFTNGTSRGIAMYGDQYVGTNVSFTDGGYPMIGTPLDFAARQRDLAVASYLLGVRPANGITTKEYGNITLKGTNDMVNIFDLDASMLSDAYSVNIEVPEGATAFINVRSDGSEVTMPNIGYNYNGSQEAGKFSKVMWNFNNARQAGDVTDFYDRVNLAGSLNGSILTPYSEVVGGYGALNGQLFAGAYSGSTQFNNVRFDGAEAVPEPASMLGLGAGVAALLAARRRKKAA